MKQVVWILGLAFVPLLGAPMLRAQSSATAPQAVPNAPQPVPDAPQQSSPAVPDEPGVVSGSDSTDSLKSLASQVAPGKASGTEPATDTTQATPLTGPAPDGPPQAEPPYVPKTAEEAKTFTIRARVNFVPVPVTVLDKRHQQVAGLTFRDFRIYENGQRQHIAFFSVDPVPLSVAFVIDQSVPRNVMSKVNESLSALQGAFTPSDEVAVFTYGSGVTEQTTFTAAQGARLTAVLNRTQARGTEEVVPVSGGPLAIQGPVINNKIVDPNLSRQTNANLTLSQPRETHALSDAILAAGQALSDRAPERRRVIYVISDGKDARSKASVNEVVRYLQTNQTSVYATMVGDAATVGLGFLDRVRLPFIPAENALPRFVVPTGGVMDGEFSTDGIEKSFARIAEKVRTQYTLGYYSKIPVLDGKFRSIDVHVERPNLEVLAKRGYYPTATNQEH